MKFLKYFKSQTGEGFNFNILPDGIFVLEQDGKIVDVNDRVLEMYRISRYDILGRYFSDYVENGTITLNKIIQSGIPIAVKSIPQHKELKPLYLDITTTRDIKTSKVYVCTRNVTEKYEEQKNIYEKYEIAQNIVDKKNDFLLGSAGVILSNLVSMAGFSRALLDGIGGAISEKQKKYLNIINTNSKDLNYDLEKLFALFKVESNKIEYKYKNFDLMSLIKSMDRVYKKDFSDKKIIYSLDYSKLTKRDCNLDGEIVEYILRCIMDIFLRFSNLGKCSLNIGHPPIDFLENRDFKANTTSETDKYVLFEAKITDLVFSEDEMENIFDAYYKGATKRSIGLKATLNLLKKYITDFGGDIWVYSKQNFGTLFTFVLPL